MTVESSYRARRLFVALLALATTYGCDSLNSLKRTVRGQDVSGLELEVQPATGITIWLDAALVAHNAPYVNRALAPGGHTLAVTARGYHPFNLPLMLRPGETIALPVALRPEAATTAPRPMPVHR